MVIELNVIIDYFVYDIQRTSSIFVSVTMDGIILPQEPRPSTCLAEDHSSAFARQTQRVFFRLQTQTDATVRD